MNKSDQPYESGQAGAEIEITPAMIEAAIIKELTEYFSADCLAETKILEPEARLLAYLILCRIDQFRAIQSGC